jgi:lipoprotein-anchoring transpeptidase ErfK/SrfK
MNFRFKRVSATFAFVASSIFLLAGCEVPNQTTVNTNANQVAVNTQPAAANAQASPSAPQASSGNQAANLPVTLPVLDAMFADDSFAAELKSKLNLNDEQINKLKQTAREATAGLRETDEGSTAQSRRQAEEQIKTILGADKAAEFTRFVSERWSGGETAGAGDQKPNSVPTDTRIVVNAPAYRMDVFKDGKLVRTYKVGIGYPEFPLPTGMRKANEIIFNPTWTPPDEPWVESPTSKVKVGEKVPAGSKLNPLGPIKIPIGLPSLIHGGKNPARLGSFASHGCVGLTNPQVQDFSLALAQISGTELTGEDVTKYEKAKTETKNVKLGQTVPVELRYETIVAENGVLKIYRDVYERGTNTEENLRRTLEAAGVSFDSLSEQERGQLMDALKQMAVDPAGNPIDMVPGAAANTNANAGAANSKNANTANKNDNSKQVEKVTRSVKGKTEIAVKIAALNGKGYPAPVDLNTGGKSKPLNLAGGDTTAAQPGSKLTNQQMQKENSRRF